MGRLGILKLGERSTLVMIAACLAVTAAVVAISIVDQKQDHEERIRARGIGIARLLSGLPSSELVASKTYQSLLQLVSFSQGSQDFAYAALVNADGSTIAEVSAPSVIVPQAPISPEPSGWIGERSLPLPNGDRNVLDFHAPVFDEGLFAGEIRLGFFEPGYDLLAQQVSAAGGIGLLIFLLAPLFYVLLRKEIKPLATAGAELERLLHARQSGVDADARGPLGPFMERFNQFVSFAQTRISELEDDRGDLVASAKLISYKKTRMESILHTLPAAILTLDECGQITFASDRITLMLGVPKDRILSMPLREWCQDSEVLAFLSRFEITAVPRYASDKVYFHPQQAPNRTYSIESLPLFSPNESSATSSTLIIIADTTQESLARQARSDFVAHLGHELKTPLNTLALYSEVLLDDNGLEPEQRIEAINTIHDEVERLTTLVRNLLNITKIEMGSMDLDKSRTRLADLLADIGTTFTRVAEPRNVSISVDTPRDLSAVDIDKDLMRVAINNLVSNAIKYNANGGKVTLSATETDDAIVVSVSDTGLGISETDKRMIFEKFFRSESSEVRNRSGHGLGLALTRQIVELHNGHVEVESELGAGSTFSITLSKKFGVVKKAI